MQVAVFQNFRCFSRKSVVSASLPLAAMHLDTVCTPCYIVLKRTLCFMHNIHCGTLKYTNIERGK